MLSTAIDFYLATYQRSNLHLLPLKMQLGFLSRKSLLLYCLSSDVAFILDLALIFPRIRNLIKFSGGECSNFRRDLNVWA